MRISTTQPAHQSFLCRPADGQLWRRFLPRPRRWPYLPFIATQSRAHAFRRAAGGGSGRAHDILRARSAADERHPDPPRSDATDPTVLRTAMYCTVIACLPEEGNIKCLTATTNNTSSKPEVEATNTKVQRDRDSHRAEQPCRPNPHRMHFQWWTGALAQRKSGIGRATAKARTAQRLLPPFFVPFHAYQSKNDIPRLSAAHRYAHAITPEPVRLHSSHSSLALHSPCRQGSARGPVPPSVLVA